MMKQLIFILFIIVTVASIVTAQNENGCPTITVSGPNRIVNQDGSMEFTAELSKEAERYKTEYVWTVKKGDLINGQGTKKISVKPKNEDSLIAEVVFTVNGFPTNCPNSVSESAAVTIDYRAYRLEFEFAEEKGLLDVFIIELQNKPLDKGFIKLIDDKKLRSNLSKYYDYLTKQGKIDPERLVFAISGDSLSKYSTNEFWIVPVGTIEPDCKDCLIIKGKDFESLQKLFAPKTKTKRKNK